MSLIDNIKFQIKQFDYKINPDNYKVNPDNCKIKTYNPYLYINDSYANYSYDKDNNKYIKNDKFRKLVYINLLEEKKIKGRFANIAIRKIKIEEDFISYTITCFIEAMLDFGLISLENYNLYIYGTENPKEIELTQTGLSLNLISRLKEAGQLENLETDKYGNLIANKKFKEFKEELDDFHQFEINRFL